MAESRSEGRPASSRGTVWFVVALVAAALLVTSVSAGSQPVLSWPLLWAAVLVVALLMLVRSRRL
ncbi:hypothetical protein GCM10025864_13240 [Luteimicrobium album]|uniref:MYXO-CTERM domain-containing protein n=1 Tax=Luteimicrobium album TaxID=1054550 RepID=A0ABQ6I1B6_9MICO|nr:hypothetical protein [Luteimicrobium album]GMA23565.1 hypothetical protein GCM10025864_13240 [Luteimicrobium album]